MNLLRKIFVHSPKTYIVALVINCAVVTVSFILRGCDAKIYLADAFGAAGMISVFVGILEIFALNGAFDVLSFSFSMLGRERKYKDLYEFTEAKEDKRKRDRKDLSFMPFITLGLLFVLASLLIWYV